MERSLMLFDLRPGDCFRFENDEEFYIVKSVNSKTVVYYPEASKTFIKKRDISKNIQIVKIK